MAQGYDGDIKLSVSLSADEVKSSAQSLSNDIKAIFDKSAGTELDSKFQKLQSSMSKTVSKAHQLQGAMERLENTKIPTDEYKEIQTQIQKATTALDKLKDRMERFTETGGKTSSSAFKKMQYDASELENTIEYAKADLQDLVDTGQAFKLGSDTEAYQNLVSQLGDVNNEMRVLTTRAEEYSQKAAEASNATEECSQKADEASNATEEYSQEVEEASSNTEEYSQKVDEAGNTTEEYSQKTGKATTETKNFGKAAENTSKKTSGFNLNLKKSFWNIMKYGLGIRSLYVLFRRVRSAITESLTTMAKMNGGVNKTNVAISSLVSSLNYLKGALGAAFAPIVSVVAPILSSFIDQIAGVINAIGMLIARLTGAKSYMKATKLSTNYAASQGGGGGKSAQEKYDEKVKDVEAKNAERLAKAEEKQAKAADKLAKKQEKANNKLADFDDLNVLGVEALEELEDTEVDLLDMPEMDLSGGGGAGDPFGLEEQALEPMENAFLDWLKQLIDAFVDGFNDAWDKLDLTNRYLKLNEYFQKIKKALLNIFTDPAVMSAFNDMMLAFMHMMGSFVADFLSIGVSLATFVIGGIAQYLSEEGTTQRIKDYLIEMFSIKEEVYEKLEELGLAIANIFTALESSEALSLSETLVGIFTEAIMNVTLLVTKFGQDLLNLIADPIINNQDKIKTALENVFGQLDGLLAPIRKVLDDFGQRLNAFYDEHLSPLIQEIIDGLSYLVGYALDLYNSYVSPFIDLMVQTFSELIEGHIGPLLDKVVGFLEPIIDLLEMLWNYILVPFFQFLLLMFSTIFNVLSPLVDFVVVGLEFVIDLVGSLIQILTDVLQFIVDIFTVGWDQAWDNLKAKVDDWITDIGKYFTIDYWKGLGGNLVEGLKQGIEDGWNSFKEGAGAIGKRIIGKFREDTDTNSPSKKAEDVGIDIIAGLFLPFSEQSVNANVTPFANRVLAVLKETLTGTSISDIGVQLVNSLIEGLTASAPSLESYLVEQFTLLTTFLNEQFALLMETVFATNLDLIVTWFDEQMLIWWNDHVLIWFTVERWQGEIFAPFFTFLQAEWAIFIKWWDDSLKKFWDDFKKWWNNMMQELKKLFEEFLVKFKDALDDIKEATDETFTEVETIIVEKIDAAKEAVLEACDEMKAAIMEVIGLMSSLSSFGGGGIAAGIAGGGGGSIGGGSGPRSFMPMFDIMHFEDNLGMSAFKFPELATGAVIPPNNEFLAVLGDQRNGMNIETPLATMIEAFRSVMDEYMSGSHQSATMEVDGETFARLMMPHIMDEMNRLGYNTEIIEGI